MPKGKRWGWFKKWVQPAEPISEIVEEPEEDVTIRIGTTFAPTEDGLVVSTSASAGFSPESGFSVSGTLSDGESVTITDGSSRFGTKPYGAKPVAYFPRDSSDGVDATLSRSPAAYSSYDATGETWQTTEKCPNRGGSLEVDMTSSSNLIGLTNMSNGFRYLFSHTKWGWNVFSDAISTNFKIARFWNAALDVSHFFATGVSGEDFRGANEGVTGTKGLSYYNYSDAYFEGLENQWQRFEAELEYSSSPGTADGYFLPWFNGTRPTVGGNSTFPDWTSGGADNWITHDTEGDQPMVDARRSQISGNTEIAGSNIYYGPELYDDSRCRVIISDESTWNNSVSNETVRDFCVTTAWAAGSITIHLRQGIHSTLSNLYLWVVKSDGSALKIGQFT